MTDPNDAPATDAARVPRRGLGALLTLYAFAVIVYVALGRSQPLPMIEPDEFIYGHLARSLTDGGGLNWRGDAITLRPVLYVLAIAPAWLSDSTTTAYAIAKSEGAFFVSLVVIPTWLLARRYLDARLALIPAALSVAGTWMISASLLLTENVAYPLATASLAAIVIAVERPGSRWSWVALGLAALASFARMQLVVLPAILLLALLLRAAADRGQALERLRADRAVVGLLAALTACVPLATLLAPGALGIYSDLGDFRPSLWSLTSSVAAHGEGLVAMAGFLPVLLVVAASIGSGAWRDARLGALLAVTWSASLVLMIESAWLAASVGTWHIERYVEYALPLVFVTALVAAHDRRVAWRHLAATTVGIGVLLLAFAPPIRLTVEERAAFAVGLRMEDLLGASTPVALALVTVVVGTAAAGLVRRLGPAAPARTAVLIAAGLGLGVLLIEDQAAWQWQFRTLRVGRDRFPRDLAWIDHAGSGPVARMIVTGDEFLWPVTEFFNHDVDRVYAPRGLATPRLRGRVCTWGIQDSGAVQFAPECGTPPRRFYLDDAFGRLTFYRQHVEARHVGVGLVARVTGEPRVLAALQVPCGPPKRGGRIVGPTVLLKISEKRCSTTATGGTAVSGSLFLDQAGSVLLRFRGGDVEHTATLGSRSYRIAPRGVTTVRVAVPSGAGGFQLLLDWPGPVPALVGAELRQGATRTNLL